MDLHCLQSSVYPGSAGQGLKTVDSDTCLEIMVVFNPFKPSVP